MQTIMKKLSEIQPYSGNAKKHDARQIKNVAESIKQYGFVQPIVIDRNGVIVIGHCRALAAKELGIKEVLCVCVDDLTPEQVNALRLVDNKSNESDWDFDLLAEELPDVDLSAFDFDWGLPEDGPEENPYTAEVKIPQYDVAGDEPLIEELYDSRKEDDLISEIEESSVSDKEKEFLKAAAHRHCVFDYRNIAEYYASASQEMQRLMERSALVIIDYDDAIANGYTELSKKIAEMRDS